MIPTEHRTIRRAVPLVAIVGLVLLSGCATFDGLQGGPVVELSARPETGRAPLLVHLDACASGAGTGVASHAWSFDDGTGDAVTAASWIDHRYERSGIYLARVTITDTAGRTSTASIEITVENAPPIPSCRISNDAPIVGERVQFDASGSSDPDGDLAEVHWDFGDGTLAQGERVSHVYTEAAVCLVRLEIEDNGGASSTLVHTMTVHLGGEGGGCGGGFPIWL